MDQEQPLRIALLIDGDNTMPGIIPPLLERLGQRGRVTTRRVYGDWTSPLFGQWRRLVTPCSLEAVQQFPLCRGKNSTDMILGIDALDLYYQVKPDIFCLVASDCDFTPLAARLRTKGPLVIGVGRDNTRAELVTACDEFWHTSAFGERGALHGAATTVAAAPPLPDVLANVIPLEPRPAAKPTLDAGLLDSLLAIVAADETRYGSCLLSRLGVALRRRQPGFDPRPLGYPKLVDLVRATGLFAIESRGLAVHLRCHAARQVRHA